MKNCFIVQMPVESLQPQHPYRLQHLLKYVLTQPVLIACQILPMNPNCIIFRMCWTMLSLRLLFLLRMQRYVPLYPYHLWQLPAVNRRTKDSHCVPFHRKQVIFVGMSIWKKTWRIATLKKGYHLSRQILKIASHFCFISEFSTSVAFEPNCLQA